MYEKILSRIRMKFDRPIIQNNLRGLWVEEMICEILGNGWEHAGDDWAGWDLERSRDGLRIEIKQSARMQTWGPSKSAAQFGISTAKGYYLDGVTYIRLNSQKRLADIYIFAWHDGTDQRVVEQWEFIVVKAEQLPEHQKSISLSRVKKLNNAVKADALETEVFRLAEN